MTKFINCVINDSKELKLIKIKVSDLRLFNYSNNHFVKSSSFDFLSL
ncbi:hypothetical protein BN1013_01374 [Candidatus Rubidus massiliensis]|nr:hypothetical protein BN1013_01374 [Candidatus Rubidus massiliensis]